MQNLSHKSQVNGHKYILTINMTTNLPINSYHGILVLAKMKWYRNRYPGIQYFRYTAQHYYFISLH